MVVDVVGSVAGNEEVIAAIAHESIAAAAGDQDVAGTAADQHVGAVTAQKDIGPAAAVEVIVALPPSMMAVISMLASIVA